MIRTSLRHAALLAAILALGIECPSLAQNSQVTFVTSLAALAGNDTINWQSYGYSPDAFPTNTNLLTAHGLGFSATLPLVGGGILDPRGPDQLGDPNDFTPSESAQALRVPYLNPYAEISINFLTPVSAVGAQLENRNANHNIGPTFTGYVSAYDGATLLGSFSETSTIQNLQNGSAPFLGVVSNTADITSMVYYVTDNNEFYIGPVSLNASPSSSVPETSTFVTASLMLGAGGLLLRHRGRALCPAKRVA
jgi:hypothetical protein